MKKLIALDYKYIEQLLERYWQCLTSVEEEHILCHFFSQEEVPAHLQRYAPLFACLQQEKKVGLSADFDEKVLARVETEVVHARRNTVRFRLLPLYRAAAVVAIVLGLGFAAQHSFEQNSEEVGVSYNYSDYKDTYSDPQVAYEQVSSALKAMSEGLRDAGLKQLDSTWVKQ